MDARKASETTTWAVLSFKQRLLGIPPTHVSSVSEAKSMEREEEVPQDPEAEHLKCCDTEQAAVLQHGSRSEPRES